MTNIKWPDNFEPENFRIFSKNQIWSPLPAEKLWNKLILAKFWPQWYYNSQNVKIAGGQPQLTLGAEFSWKTFHSTVKSKVLIFEPFEHLGWDAREMLGWHGFHGWHFLPQNQGTLIVTEEVQKGPGDIFLAGIVKNSLETSHQIWLEQLIKE